MSVSKSKSAHKRPWQDIAREAQEHRDASIAEVRPPIPDPPEHLPKNVMGIPATLLSEDELSITKMPPEELVAALASGQLTAVAVTTAFLRRAGLAQKLVNCATELLPTQALGRAQYLDDYLAKNGRPIGPLHGLPISVKEHIGMKGLHLSAGYVAWYDRIAEEDAHILQILFRAGAIFHVRTTVPQSMMHLETSNNLYGITVNPYNSLLSSGGSSGGEGALIALRGSCLGIGSDVGGSIRSPAANCGVWGFKPTAFKVPTDGWGYAMAGADAVDTVLGPLSTSLKGLMWFMRVILDAKPWLEEPAVVPIPWREYHVEERKLRVGVMWHDGVVRPHPPIVRALEMVVEKLREAGVEVVDWKPHAHDEAWAIIASLYYPDGGEEDSEVIDSSGEPWRPLTKWIIKENSCVKKLSVGELNYWVEEREVYRKEYAKVWNETATKVDEMTGEPLDAVDVILCPVGPGVAPKHDTAKYWGYTSTWNLLNFPAAVFPVTKVDKKVDILTQEGKSLSGKDTENRELYDAEEYHGLPVSLQLVGRRFEDEKVLAILEHIVQRIGLPFAKFP